MPARKVWDDFVRLEDRAGHAKQQYQPGEPKADTFARWRCPHCSLVLEARAEDAVDKKADVCAKHFWNKTAPCQTRPAADLRGQPKPKAGKAPVASAPVVGTAVSGGESAVIATLQANHTEQMAAQRAQHEELMRALTGRLETKTKLLTATFASGGLSPPRSDDDDDAFGAKVDSLDERLRMKEAQYVTEATGASPPRAGESARVATARGIKRCAEDAALDVCGICQTRRPDAVMLPCLHLSACESCWSRWQRRRLEALKAPRCTKCHNIVKDYTVINLR